MDEYDPPIFTVQYCQFYWRNARGDLVRCGHLSSHGKAHEYFYKEGARSWVLVGYEDTVEGFWANQG